jgi:CPA1 family monovalent cation:H+ antiporter
MVLLFVAIVLSLITRKIRLPFAVTLVIVGLVLAEFAEHFPALMPMQGFALSPDILTYIFLPTLVFETAFVLDSRMLSKNPCWSCRFPRCSYPRCSARTACTG